MSSSGVTPLEAAARAIGEYSADGWDRLNEKERQSYREWAIAALRAAIEALSGDRIFECGLPSPHQGCEECQAVFRAALGRAFGLEGPQ